MENKKQTAAEWFFEQIIYADIDMKVWEKIAEQAKEMEKEQIVNAWIATDNELQRMAAEQYYEETYGNEDDLSDWDVTLNDGLPDEK